MWRLVFHIVVSRTRKSVESIKTYAPIFTTISFSSEEIMSNRSCKSCGKFCVLRSDMIRGYCLDCVKKAEQKEHKPTIALKRATTDKTAAVKREQANLKSAKQSFEKLRSSAKADADRLNQMRASLRARERMLSERDRQIENRAQELKRVHKLNSALLEKIHRERSGLDQERRNIADEKKTLASKRRDVDRLRTQLSQSEKRQLAATRKLENRERALSEKEASLKKREKQVANIPKSRKEFAARVKKFEQQILRLRNNAARQKDEMEFLRGYSEVADWAGTGLGSKTLWPNVEHVVLAGSEPYDKSEFAAYLDGKQFVLEQPGSSEAAIMIVGRDDWSAEELEAQIEAREGQELRVYSQEMILLAIRWTSATSNNLSASLRTTTQLCSI